MEVSVIVEDNTRRPDYDGAYRVIEDRGETMIIEPIVSQAELLAEMRDLRAQLEAKDELSEGV